MIEKIYSGLLSPSLPPYVPTYLPTLHLSISISLSDEMFLVFSCTYLESLLFEEKIDIGEE
jgi:hypothetical protein